MEEQVRTRVASLLVRQMESANPDGEPMVTMEMCDHIRRGYGMIVLDAIKENLKHGSAPVQLKTLNVLNQCVLNSGPEFAVALSSEKWTDRLFKIGKSAESEVVRDKIVRLVVDWTRTYRTTGFQQCASRFANSKTLGPVFIRIAGEQRRAIEAGNASFANSNNNSVYAVPAGSQNAARGGGPTRAQYMDPSGRSSFATAPPQASAATNANSSSSSPTSNRLLSNIDTFLLDAQGDLASLEYSLENPDMLDENIARECKKHKMHAGRILQHDDIPEDVARPLMSLLEQLSSAIEIFEAITAIDIGEGGVGNTVLRNTYSQGAGTKGQTAVQSFGSTTVKQSSDDDDDEEDAKPAVAAASRVAPGRRRVGDVSIDLQAQAQAETVRLLEKERQEGAQLRKQLDDEKQRAEEFQKKFTDAKTKNKKAVALVEEYAEKIDQLEAQLAEAPAAAASATPAKPPPPQVIEKIIEKKAKVDPQVLQNIQFATASLRQDLRAVRSRASEAMKDTDLDMAKIRASIGQIVASGEHARQSDLKALQWAQELYKKEMKLRKQYYNTIQELKGNIRVYVRTRPMSETELSGGHTCVLTFPSGDEIRIQDPTSGRLKVMEFDQVYSPATSQEQVFSDTAPLIDSVVDGYNVCIFAYGQTGSGKTFTMSGYTDKGINKRALDRLFSIIAEREESEESTVHVSVLEIYCEQIRDLLVSRNEASKTVYDVKMGGPYGNYVTNLKEAQVVCAGDIDSIMNLAQSNRSEGKTDMNSHSSRSHMILYVIVKTRNKHTNAQSYGKLSLVDLAGSERLDKSGSEGQQAKEAVAINKSLSALGDVIAGLGQTGKTHVPFRNSLLTFLLQDSMAGQAKVLMFCCVSPASYNTSETNSSLQFAARARGVSLGQVKKNVVPETPR